MSLKNPSKPAHLMISLMIYLIALHLHCYPSTDTALPDALGINVLSTLLCLSGIVIILSDRADDLIASLGEFNTKIALGSHASNLQARTAIAGAPTLLLENIHLALELCTDILQFKGRLLVATCKLDRPPPKHVLSKIHTIILEDTRSFSQILESNQTLVIDPRIAFIHTWICHKERTHQFSKKYGFTLEDMKMADGQHDLKGVMSIYTSRIETDSFDWREIKWLMESVFSEEGFWDEPNGHEADIITVKRMQAIGNSAKSTEFARKKALHLLEIIKRASIDDHKVGIATPCPNSSIENMNGHLISFNLYANQFLK